MAVVLAAVAEAAGDRNYFSVVLLVVPWVAF